MGSAGAGGAVGVSTTAAGGVGAGGWGSGATAGGSIAAVGLASRPGADRHHQTAAAAVSSRAAAAAIGIQAGRWRRWPARAGAGRDALWLCRPGT